MDRDLPAAPWRWLARAGPQAWLALRSVVSKLQEPTSLCPLSMKKQVASSPFSDLPHTREMATYSYREGTYFRVLRKRTKTPNPYATLQEVIANTFPFHHAERNKSQGEKDKYPRQFQNPSLPCKPLANGQTSRYDLLLFSYLSLTGILSFVHFKHVHVRSIPLSFCPSPFYVWEWRRENTQPSALP